MSKIPYFNDSDIQSDSFPDANFLHMAKLLQSLSPNPDTQKEILAVGLNNREQQFEKTSKKQLQELWRAATRTFPNATIYTPLINFSNLLPRYQQDHLRKLNSFIYLSVGQSFTRDQFPQVQGGTRLHSLD